MIRTLGIDIGIASIGWAVIEGEMENGNLELKKIVKSGVRIFKTAENPKDGKSLALPRREARSSRRRNARKRGRILQVKTYLSKTLKIPLEEMLGGEKLSPMFQTSRDFISPWELRSEALCRCLAPRELARVILHIAKRRGYDDITYGLDDKEGGKVIKAIQENQAMLVQKGYKTIGEMMYQSYYQKPREGVVGQMESVRNQDGDYKRCVGRSELREELEIILDTQKKLGNPYINDEFKKTLLGDKSAIKKKEAEGLVFFQRPLKSFEDKIGKCQFFNDENRSCKDSPSAEKFVVLTKIINTLANITNTCGILWEDKKSIISQIFTKAMEKKSGVSYADLRKILNLPQTFAFKELDYSKDKVENTKFFELKSTHELLKANPNLSIQRQDKIAEILGEEKNWERIQAKLEKEKFSSEEIARIKEANLKFSKHINLSLKALYFLLPLMEEGKRYDEAVEILQKQGDLPIKKSEKSHLLPSLQEIAKEDSYFDIANPVVNRALSEFRKVVNALIEQYGGFHFFNIELTRQVGRSFLERTKIKKEQESNKDLNLQALSLVKEYGLSENAKNILKLKLWILQGERCIYSGKKITRELLRDETSLDIDHIFPLSRSLDDSQANKVLCLKSENAQKKNRTPYEYLGGDETKWQEFVARVFSTKFDKNKKGRLISKNFKDRNVGERAEFLARNLVDTGYISRVVSRYVEENLEFLPLEGRVRRVRIVSGSLTTAMRAYWGISGKSREHHLHHAQDAIIISCINDSTIQKFSKYLKDKELSYKDSEYKVQQLNEAEYKTKLALRYPMKDFSKNISESISEIFVSHAPSHKVTGALHEETIESHKNYKQYLNRKYKTYVGDQQKKKKDFLSKIEWKKKIYEDDIKKSGESIDMTEWLRQKEEVWKEENKMSLKNHTLRLVNGGLAKNETMPRVDVFRSKDKGKFYAVPIYTYDFALGILPNKAIVAKDKGKTREWLEMDESYEFCFSLFKNDYVKIQAKGMQNPVIAIYTGTGVATASMNFSHHSGYEFASEDERAFFTDVDKKTQASLFSRTNCGIQNLKIFQKVQVSPLGEIKECKPSKRQAIRLKTSPKNV